jgi:hypothetical protein
VGRIRSIKPEFPQSETTGKLSRDARLLFIQLWTIVDDEGRARAASRMLASLLYPYDDDVPNLIGGWLAELVQNDCIRLYIAEGSTYLEIVNWLKHQKIDHPSKSRLPAFSEALAKPREPSRSLAPDLGPRIRTKDQESCRVATATPTTEFEDFWKEYPKRKGTADKQSARKSFEKLVKAGTKPSDLIAAARNYCAEVRSNGNENTEFVPMAATWLNKQRHLDYLAGPPVGAISDDEKMKLFAQLRNTNGRPNATNPDLRGASVGARKIEGAGREEPAPVADDHPGDAGMGSLEELLRIPRV